MPAGKRAAPQPAPPVLWGAAVLGGADVHEAADPAPQQVGAEAARRRWSRVGCPSHTLPSPASDFQGQTSPWVPASLFHPSLVLLRFSLSVPPAPSPHLSRKVKLRALPI